MIVNIDGPDVTVAIAYLPDISRLLEILVPILILV